LEKVEQAKATSEKTLIDLLGFSQNTARDLTILGDTSSVAPGNASSRGDVPFSVFPSALAQSVNVAQSQSSGFDPGIRLDRPGYVVVLKAANTEEEAKKWAEQLRSTIPSAQAIKTDKGLFVIDSAAPRSQSARVKLVVASFMQPTAV
jgi:hypothetical protein